MKIAILGCGNMGGAIAHGLAKSGRYELAVTSKSGTKAQELAAIYNKVEAAATNRAAVEASDVVVVAVKPWLVSEVLDDVEDLLSGKTVLSVAAGVRDERIQAYAMPNIAAEFGQSMTFIEQSPNDEALRMAQDLFAQIGRAEVVSEKQMQAGMMMAGCGIAYVMRMVRALMQGGTELGFRPADARDIAIQTLQGTATLLSETGLHPEEAIDRVTTPGGFTIKGLNALDHAGFSSAVINALKAGLK